MDGVVSETGRAETKVSMARKRVRRLIGRAICCWYDIGIACNEARYEADFKLCLRCWEFEVLIIDMEAHFIYALSSSTIIRNANAS